MKLDITCPYCKVEKITKFVIERNRGIYTQKCKDCNKVYMVKLEFEIKPEIEALDFELNNMEGN